MSQNRSKSECHQHSDPYQHIRSVFAVPLLQMVIMDHSWLKYLSHPLFCVLHKLLRMSTIFLLEILLLWRFFFFLVLFFWNTEQYRGIYPHTPTLFLALSLSLFLISEGILIFKNPVSSFHQSMKDYLTF